MTTLTVAARTFVPAREPVEVLRWVFLRDSRALTCELRMNGRFSHDVCVVPHWNIGDSVVERFRRPADALQRHAEIARDLREGGWRNARSAGPSSGLAA